MLVFLHSYQLQWRKTSYSKKKNSKYKTSINYNKQNNLFKVQNKCVFLSLHKWSCSLYTPKTENIKCPLPRIPCWLLILLFPILPVNLVHQLNELIPDQVLILLCINLHFLGDLYIEHHFKNNTTFAGYNFINHAILVELLLSTLPCFKNNTTSQLFISWSIGNYLGWFISLGTWDKNQASNHELKLSLFSFKILSGLPVTSIVAARLRSLFLPNQS